VSCGSFESHHNKQKTKTQVAKGMYLVGKDHSVSLEREKKINCRN